MAVRLPRQPPPKSDESFTRIKRARPEEPLDDRSALVPEPPTHRVKMKIPHGMPVLPGGRRMPPLPVRLRESLAPLRRSFAPFFGDSPRESAQSQVESLRPSRRRGALLTGLLVLAAAGAAAWWLLFRGA